MFKFSRSHASYWALSKPALKLMMFIGNGPAMPGAATAEGWNEWHRHWSARSAPLRNRIAYAIAHDGVDWIQDVVTYPVDFLDNARYYLYNRFVVQSHALVAHSKSLEYGMYHDLGERLLACSFDALVDYVEVELAHMHVNFHNKEDQKKYGAPWWRIHLPYFLRLKAWRSSAAGLAHLDWEVRLQDDPEYGDPSVPNAQSARALEVRALYHWWTVTRPARPDPYEASGWAAIARAEHEDDKHALSWCRPATPEKDAAIRRSDQLEQEYRAEDDAMLARLIAIRHDLWT